MRSPLAFVGLAVLPLAVPPSLALAQGAAPRHTKASLVAETDVVEPGRALSVGIRLQMDPGWHTYWRNPGDSGLATRVRWTLPAGVEAGEIRWPAPERFMTGPLVSYGYAREVLLPVEIRVPRTFSEPELRLTARVDWLECQELCLPGKAEVSLALPLRAGSRGTSANGSGGAPAKAGGSGDAAALAEAKKSLPLADPSWRLAARQSEHAIELTFDVTPVRLTEAYFYPITPHLVDYGKPQTLERTKTGYRLSLARDPNAAPAERLNGVLVTGSGGARRAIEVDTPLGRDVPPGVRSN